MKFIIEKNALTWMLRVLASNPKKDQSGSLLRLAAQDGQIILNAYETEAGCEALVLEEGVCFFRIAKFLRLVRSYASARNQTIEVTPEGGRENWEISLFQNPQIAPMRLPITQRSPEPAEGKKPEQEELPLWAWAKRIAERTDEIQRFA